MESLPLTGHAIFQHPSMKNSQLDIFHLSSKGSVYKLNAKLTEDIDDINRPHGEQRHSVWDGDMEVLHTGSKTLDTDLGPLTIRDHSDVDLAPAYNRKLSTLFSTIKRLTIILRLFYSRGGRG